MRLGDMDLDKVMQFLKSLTLALGFRLKPFRTSLSDFIAPTLHVREILEVPVLA